VDCVGAGAAVPILVDGAGVASVGGVGADVVAPEGVGADVSPVGGVAAGTSEVTETEGTSEIISSTGGVGAVVSAVPPQEAGGWSDNSQILAAIHSSYPEVLVNTDGTPCQFQETM